MWRRTAWIVASAVVVAMTGLAVLSASAARPKHLGVHNGRLAPCPASPNAVSSQALDAAQQVPSLPLTTSPASAIRRLSHLIGQMPRAAVITETENYLHAEFRSLAFRFPDDFEVYCDQYTNRIHFRSASRVGYSDLGVNRARVVEVQRQFESGAASANR